MLFSGLDPLTIVFSIISLLIALSVHESAHAYVADRLGDPTARLQGRITLNPIRHIDYLGLIFILFTPIGWAKPVMVDSFNFKNPRKDTSLVSIAGPASNVLLALVLSILCRSFNLFNLAHLNIISYFFIFLIRTNITIAFFNLIPIYPLDGFSVVGGLLSEDQAHDWFQLQRYGMIFLLLLIIPLGSSSMLDTILQPILRFVVPLFVPM